MYNFGHFVPMGGSHNMASFNNGLKRNTLAVALGLCFAGGVQAQSSVGSIFGDTTANAAVTIENLDTGTSRQINSDSTGHFTFSQLSPGRYRVTSGGTTREVQVKVGTGTQVNLVAATGGATTLDTVTVVGSSAINPIDVSSVESTTVFTQEQIQALPVGRDITNVALLAPGTVKGDTGFGNLASFGGSSVAENGYYINGFDVTNIRNFLSYANLPFEAIGQQQVKSGGYGAEYGRSLGGVISLVTKRGTNQWKAGGAMYYEPHALRSKGQNVANREPNAPGEAPEGYTLYQRDDERQRLNYNVYAGGPIIENKLFVFGLIETRNNTTDNYGQEFSTEERNRSPNGMLKLDWNITDNHIVELTGIYNKSKVKTKLYENAAEYSTSHDGTPTESVFESGGRVYIGKYTGYLTDNLTVSAQYGKVENLTGKTIGGDTAAALCPAVYDAPGLVYRGCWDVNHFTVLDPFAPDNEDTREAGRLDVEWVLGDHTL
ncbi:MAG TPA: TonB-dependent receptor, partial [Ilumatobacteraceae bacterium]|nr:TonB-dependent receptor [Ilumatobacteraceae bacterium]